MPVADGGDGTAAVMTQALGGRMVTVATVDASGRPVEARYGLIAPYMAVIELASASGLGLIAPDERDPLRFSTFGTGLMIADAIGRGCRRIELCVGGSATNDAGTGILAALGFRFTDAAGNVLEPCGASLSAIEKIDSSASLPQLHDCTFTVACDVDNPFCGPHGAACVYAPQKGADEEAVRRLDDGMCRFARLLKECYGTDVLSRPGAGAAGGTAGTLVAVLGARLVPGARMVLGALGFDEAMRSADLVITGEGCMDAQTLHDKAPMAVMRQAVEAGVPVIGIGGRIDSSEALLRSGFSDLIEVSPREMSLCEAMRPEVARGNISGSVANYFQKFR